MEERPLGSGRDTANDDLLVPTAALPPTHFRATFFAPGVGEVGGGPAFEMLSDLPEITEPVSDGTGISAQTF